MTSLRCSDILEMVSAQVRGSGLWSKAMMKAEHSLTVSEPGVLLTERAMFQGKPPQVEGEETKAPRGDLPSITQLLSSRVLKFRALPSWFLASARQVMPAA